MEKRVKSFFLNCLLWAVILFLAFPILFIFTGSFMSAAEVVNRYGNINSGFSKGDFAHLRFLPQLFSLEQYRNLFLYSPDYMYAYLNSILLAVPALIGNLLIAPLAGYSLAKYRFRFKTIITGLYILLALLPYHTMIVPNYIMINKLNLLDTRMSVWLTQMFHPLGVFICYRWMDKLSDEIIESIEIDGAGTLQKYTYIVLPLSRPALATVLVLSAADLWGMIEQPLVFLKSKRLTPLSVLISNLGNEQIETTFAYGIIFAMPMLLLFLILKNDFLYGVESIVPNERKDTAL